MERVKSERGSLAKPDASDTANAGLPHAAEMLMASNQSHTRDAELAQSPEYLDLPVTTMGWDAQYRRLLDNLSTADPHVRGLHVASLISRFREGAELVSHTIIEELVLPDEAKSIQPLLTDDRDEFLATNGVVTSISLDKALTRYHHNGMLIYMVAVGEQFPTASQHASPSVFNATRIQLEFSCLLKHHIAAAQALHKAIQEIQRDRDSKVGSDSPMLLPYQLGVPLQCTVDYLGFRCFVIASNTTHIKVSRSVSGFEGASSAAQCITGTLQEAFERLGLFCEYPPHSSKPELTEPSEGFTLPPFFPSQAGCSTQFDGEVPFIMLHNLTNLFPPAQFSDSGLSAHEERPQIPSDRIRCEFVLQHGSLFPCASNMVPGERLSEDTSLSSVGTTSTERIELTQLALQSAAEHLTMVVIPSFMDDLEATPLQPMHSREFTEALHAWGINVKLLGRCYSLAQRVDTKRLILSEMFARAAKVELGISLRAVVHECIASSNGSNSCICDDDGDTSGSNDANTTSRLSAVKDARLALLRHAIESVIIEFFNLLFGTTSHPDSKLFWENRILPRVRDKFPLQENYTALTFELIASGDHVHLPQLFHAVQAQTNIILSDHMKYNFHSPAPISKQDLVGIESSSKASVRMTTECDEILAATDDFIACGELDAALDNIKLELSNLKMARGGDDCQHVLLSHYLTCAAELSLRLNCREDAQEYAALAADVAPRNHVVVARALTVAMALDDSSDTIEIVERYFKKAVSAVKWHLGPSSLALADIFVTMANAYLSAEEFERAEVLLADCAELSRQVLGRWSLPYADARRWQAILMHRRCQLTDIPSHDEILGVLHDAIDVYEHQLSAPANFGSCTQTRLLVASSYYLAAEIATIDQDAYTMAFKSLAARKTLLPSVHEDVLASNLQLAEVAERVGEPFRAVENCRQALAILKRGTSEDGGVNTGDESRWDDRVNRIRDVSQKMLRLFLASLSDEQQDIVDRVKQRFGSMTSSLKTLELPKALVGPNSDVMSAVVRNLFIQDPVEYLSWLIDSVENEGVPSSRPTLSLAHSMDPDHSAKTTNEFVDWTAIRTNSGDITLDVQLAIVVFLAEAPDTETTTD